MKNLVLTLAFSLVIGFCAVETSAQFEIKIPKIKKPKAEQPKADEPNTNSSTPNDAKQNDNRSSPQSQKDYLTQPEPNDAPVFLIETLEIKAKNEAMYWKTPNQNNVANWFPQVQFGLFYNFGNKTTRFTSEWFKPDGSLWFSEGLERYDNGLRSPYESKQFHENSVITTGTYGLKITDTKTGKVHFQGKFKVNKTPIPKEDVKTLFYVDNEWMLPTAYVGFEKGYTDYNVRTQPMAFFWFKGNLDNSKFEAELYYDNQKINTTDKGGYVNKHAERGETCYQARQTCAYGLYAFAWKDFLVDNSKDARLNNPGGWFTKDKPGEYQIKVYYNGEPVREAKFTVDAKGWIARNAFSEQIFLNDYRVVVPAKVIGNMEKWNPASVKTDAFYGNPLNGFSVQ